MPPFPRCILWIVAAFLATAMILCSGCVSDQASAPATLPPAETLVFYTEQLPPYNYMENGTLQGIAVDLLVEATAGTAQQVTRDNMRLVPWTEGYQAALTQNNTVIFTTVRLPERENSFKWAGPLYTYTNVLFARPDRNIVIADNKDLAGYRIGVIRDDLAVLQLKDAGVNESQLVMETNASVLVNKLRDGSIDLWAYGEAPGRYFAGQVTGNYYAFKVVSTLPPMECWYAFNRNVPDSTVASIQQRIDALKQEKDARGVSRYEKILGRYIPSFGFTQLTYLTEEWAPYNYAKDGVPSGISVDILEAIFRTTGANLSRSDVRIVPLSEGFRQAQGPNGTVLFSIVRSPERDPLYKWAGPFTRAGFVVYAPVSRNITIASPSDLNKYRIGAVKGTIENTLLVNQGVNASNIVNGLVPADLIAMLEKGEIDLWATGDVTGRYEMQTAGVNPDDYEIVTTLSENDFWFVFSKDVPDPLIRTFSYAIATVRNQKGADGLSEYEKIIYRNIGVGCARQSFSDDAVMALVNATAQDIEKDAPGTLLRINAQEAPYRDAVNRELYVFVYDTNLTTVAHADNSLLIGYNTKGKPDVAGRMFHDEILAGALANGSGRVEYVYMNPVQMNLYYKTTYYRLTRGSDGNTYIVGSGNFKACKG